MRQGILVFMVVLAALSGCSRKEETGSKSRPVIAVIPIAMGAIALALAPSTQGNLVLTILCFMVAFAGFKAYLPIF